MNDKMMDLLYQSHDRDMTPDERRHLDAALADSPELRQEKERILTVRQTLADGKATAFKPFFTTRVMGKILTLQEEESFFESLLFVFYRTAAAAVILIILLTGYNLMDSNDMTVTAAFTVDEGEPTLALLLEPDYSDMWELGE